MFERPSIKFAMGAVIGGLASLTISVGLMPFIVTVAFALFVGVVWRSHAVLSGVLCGFGVTWLVLIGSSYVSCVAMGPNCAGSESMVPFLIIAGVAFVLGVAVGLRAIVRERAKVYGPSGGTP